MKQLSILFMLCIGLFACTPERTERDKPLIVCTTNIIQDGIHQIFGDRLEVVAMMGVGVDPHSYQPTMRDTRLLADADVIVGNGLHLEGKLSEALEQLKSRKPVLELGELISVTDLRKTTDFQGVYDPHIWFDPALWNSAITKASDSIGVILELGDAYEGNLTSYVNDLSAISTEWKSKLAEVPDSSRILVTSHDAFWYFGRAFNIEVKALQGISTVTEAGAKDVVDLVNFIVDRKVKTIFFESSVPKERLEAVIDGVKEKGHEITFGGMLFSDALGDKEQNAETLSKVYEHNLKVIYDGLR